jgi:hypothetical protein
MAKIAHQVDAHAGQYFLGQESKDILQQDAGQDDQADIYQDVQLTGGSLAIILDIIIESIYEPGGRERKSGQMPDDLALACIKKNVKQGNEQRKIHEAKDDKKEYIDDIFGDIMMIGP